MIAAVRNMAVQAILIHRGMGPHERSSLLGVALVTEFIRGIRLELSGAKTSMVFVAIRALDLSFPDRMVGSPGCLGPDALVAGIAEVRLRAF